jgi:L-alanine-DL-glutamate epimerase-like enolase superfamily enzyme
MRISEFETRLYLIPLTVGSSDATPRVLRREFVVTTLKTDTGICGTGLAYTYGQGGTAVRELVDTALKPLVMGSDPRDIERIWSRCWRELCPLGSAGMIRLALAAVDIALWDILAQQADVPLFRLLGGCRECIPAYASGILMDLDGEPLCDQMHGFVERGYHAVKMRVGREHPEEDAERVAAVRRQVGPKVQLMLDATQQWTAGEAIRRANLFRRFDPCWLEEPIAAEDRTGHVEVRTATGIPLAAGETLSTRHEFADFLRAGALDIVQPDIVRVGGFTEWMKIARLAEGFHLPVAPHFVMELSVHALCAVPNGLILEDLQGGSFTELGLLEEPIRVVNGEMAPPARPGHGIRFSERELARYEVIASPKAASPQGAASGRYFESRTSSALSPGGGAQAGNNKDS